MPDIHHSIGGSNAHIWIHCPATVLNSRLCQPTEAGAAAARGTRIHALAEKIYNGITTFAEDDFEEVAIAQRYVSALKAKFKSNGLIEFYCKFNDVDAGGTIDYISYDPDEKCLYIVDLKTGKGKVNPVENWQLLFYAMCAIHNTPYCNMKIDTFCLGIYQDEEFKWWTISWSAYMQLESEMGKAIEATTHSFVPEIPGKHCFWCKGKDHCLKQVKVEVVKKDSLSI